MDPATVQNAFNGIIEPTEEFGIRMGTLDFPVLHFVYRIIIPNQMCTQYYLILQNIDKNDPLSKFRNEFHIPPRIGNKNKDSIYLCGNSLGLLPKRTQKYLNQELTKWSQRGVEGHFEGKRPWQAIDEKSCELVLPLVGAIDTSEVAIMNGLSVNNNLLLLSFYQPTKQRYKILIEGQAFCSDHHTIRSHLKFHGISEKEGLIEIFPNTNNTNKNNREETISTKDICDMIDKHNDSLALVWLGAVQYYTGQFFDIKTICSKAHEYNIIVGFDLAHAVGNIPLKLHSWNVDFATFCSYKYLNSGPGSIAGIFVHNKHNSNKFENKRLTGWWGQELKDRFLMKSQHVAKQGAQSWQMSNPPVLPTVCLEASLEIFNEAGIENLRRKSIYLTGYLECLLNKYCSEYVSIITPKDCQQRGCQLSLVFNKDVQMVCCFVFLFCYSYIFAI